MTADHSYSGGTTIASGTLQLGNGGTSGSILGDVINNGTLAFNRSVDLTVSGAISGSGSIVQMGTNTLTLTGNNTNTGITTIANGTLQIGNGGTVGRLGGDVVDNGTLAFNHSDDITFTGAISGSGGIAKLGSNTLILTGNNAFTGTSRIAGGTLQVGNGGTSGTLTGSIVNNASIVFNRSDNSSSSANISGTGSLTFAGAGTTALTGTNSYSGATTLTSGILNLGGARALSSNTTIVFNGGTLQASAANSRDYSSQFSTAAGQQYKIDTNGQDVGVNTALVSSGGSLIKSGEGSLHLGGANTYTGATTISGGTVVLDKAASPSLVLDSNVGVGRTVWADQSGHGNNATSLAGQLNYSGEPNGALYVGLGPNSLLTVPVSSSGSTYTIFTMLQVPSSTTNGTLLGSTVAGGLQINAQGSLLYLAQGSTITTAIAGYLEGFSRGVPILLTSTVSPNGTSMGVSNNGAATITNSFDDAYYTPPAQASNFLIGNTPAGTAGYNAQYFAILIYTSTLSPTQMAAVQNSLNDEFVNLDARNLPTLGSGSLPGQTALNLTGNGSGLDLNDHVQAVGSVNGVSGSSIYLGNGVLITGADNTDASFAGVIRDDGGTSTAVGGNFGKTGTGTQVLSGLNTYTGQTVITGGTLSVSKLDNGGKASGIGASTNAAANLVLDGGSLQYTGSGDSTDRAMTLGVSGGTLDSSGAGAVNFTNAASLAFATPNVAETLTLAGNNTQMNIFNAAIGDNGTSTTSVVKNGAGTWQLTGNNTYTGGTTINQGNLDLKGNVTGSVTVQSGASFDVGSGSTVTGGAQVNGGTIGGSGTVAGKITVASGGSTYPGDPQILTAGSVEYQAGSTAQFAVQTNPASAHPPVAGTDYDQMKLTASGLALQIDPGSTLQLNLTTASLATLQGNAGDGDIYFLFTLPSGSNSGQFDSLTLSLNGGETIWTGALTGGEADFDALNLGFNFSYEADATDSSLSGGHDLAFTVNAPQAVPEPSTWMLLVLAAGGLACYRRYVR